MFRTTTQLGSARALLLAAIALSVALSGSLALYPVYASISPLKVTPNNVTTKSGTTVQVIGFAVSTTYSRCWGICEATWFGAYGVAPYVDSFLTTRGCSMANYNTFLWSGTCTVTIFLYVNDGGVTPPGTYHPLFFVYTYRPSYYVTTITLTVT